MRNSPRIVAGVCLLAASASASAITITATQDDDTLVNALLAGAGSGIAVTSQVFTGQQQTNLLTDQLETSSGTYTNGVGGTYGIGPGIVLTTGAVQERSFTDPETQVTEIFSGYGDGPNRVSDNSTAYLDSVTFQEKAATAEQEALLQPISPFPHYDVTELLINFDVAAGFDRVQFNVAYGTDEYIEFKNSDYIDIFAIFLNDTNIAIINGNRFNVDHPDFAEVTGTELDGLLAPGGNPLLTLSGSVNPGANTLRFIVADTGDSILDSTVYISTLSGVAAVPAPAGVWLLGTAMGLLAGRHALGRRRRLSGNHT